MRGRRAPWSADALERALAGLCVVTAGAVHGLDRPDPSQVAQGPGPAADRVWGWSRIDGDGAAWATTTAWPRNRARAGRLSAAAPAPAADGWIGVMRAVPRDGAERRRGSPREETG